MLSNIVKYLLTKYRFYKYISLTLVFKVKTMCVKNVIK